MTGYSTNDAPTVNDQPLAAGTSVVRVSSYAPVASSSSPPRVLSQHVPSMSMVMKSLRRNWLLAAILAPVMALGAAAATCTLLPLLFRESARALIHVPEENPYVLFPDRSKRQDYVGFKKTQATLIKSRLVLNSALQNPKISSLSIVQQKPDPIAWLERDLKVDYSAGPEILTVMLTGDNEEELAAVVNAVVTTYHTDILKKATRDRSDKIDQLKLLRSKYLIRLESQRKELKRLVDDAGTKDPTNLALKARIALEQLAAAQKDMTQLQSEVRRLQVESSQQGDRENEALSGQIPEHYFKEALDKDPQIAKYNKRHADLQAVVTEIKRVAPDRYEQLSKKERSELESVKQATESYRQLIRPALEAQVRERLRGEYEARESQKKQRLEFLRGLQTRLSSDIEDLDKDSRKTTRISLDLETTQQEIAEINDMLKKIGLELEALNVEEKAPQRITILEDAQITRPDRKKIQVAAAGMAGLGTLMLVLFGLGWWEYRLLRVDSADQLTRDLGVPVMGTIPHVPFARRTSHLGPASASTQEWSCLLLESVDALRTILLHVAQSGSMRAVMVTSAMEGEGKTSLSSQLATSLARAGRKTLLVDGDLRQSELHRVFALSEPDGLCEVLRGERHVADVIQLTGLDGLWVLAGGRCDDAALCALARGGMAKVLQDLRESFDFILVDSAPVLTVADSLLMSQCADGVLFSIMQNVSRLGPVHMAYERLASLGARILGAVLVGTPELKLYGRPSRYLARGTPIEAAAEPAPKENS